MDVIRLLPDSLANQIAAGEVVQRPSSVVKELLENSLDAGATEIQLIVQDAGKTLVQVIDNGCGMSETDARMSFERHATSKIKTSQDLFQIQTFGFRGEALASVAAVAQVEMKTRRQETEIGTLIRIEASELKEQKPVACPKGTSVAVKNLFYNVPVRRNFLKSNMVEFRHIVEEFQHAALAYPDVAFSLYHNQQELYVLKPGSIAKRIVALLGKNYQENLIPCQEEVSHVRIQGFIGKPACAKKTKGDQFFYVNQRYIKHAYLHHAVMSAFEGLIPAEHYPFYLLNITIDPKHIDVNVHPTKTEVKFDDERTIYAVIRAAALQALSTHGATPSLDFTTDVNFTEKWTSSRTPQETSFSSFRSEESERKTNNLKNWEKLYAVSQSETNRTTLLQSFEQAKTTSIPYANTTKETTPHQAERKQIMQLHQEYILCQVRSGLMVVDLKAAYERIFFERYSRLMEGKTGASQKILFTHPLSLSATERVILETYMTELQALGFYVELQKDRNYWLTAVPAEVAQQDAVLVLQEIFREIKETEEVKITKSQKLLKAISKRTATMATKKILDVTEAQNVIEQLFACTNPHYSPTGTKIVATLSMEEISKLFD